MILFNLPGGEQRLILTSSVLSFMDNYRQTTRRRAESGGQLFAKITPKLIVVAAATGPHRKDLRSRFAFVPNKKRLAAEIQAYFLKGLHYVGDWHTHPQKSPKPSWLDTHSMQKCFSKSKHSLEHFLIVIVGNAPPTSNLWVGLINHTHAVPLPGTNI